MDWAIHCEGKTWRVTAERADDVFVCRLGRRTHRVRLIADTETSLTCLLDDHHVVHADVQWEGNECCLLIEHVPFTFTVYPAQSRSRAAPSAGPEPREGETPSPSLRLAPPPHVPASGPPSRGIAQDAFVVKAPMPARVVDVKVAVGDRVTAGQLLLVVEAMKMQNEILAPADGTITAVHVTMGQAVEANQSLVSFTA